VFEILGRVDANRVVGRFDGPDAQAVLERAELLERFGELERCGSRAARARRLCRRYT